MDLQAKDSESRFAAYVEGLASVIGHADRTGPLRDYCIGSDAAGRAQERRADGGDDGAGADGGAASVAAAFCRSARLVGREGVGQGARDGAAGDRAARADRGLDHRRHRLSQAREALGRRGAAILRSARQAGQLPGGGVAVDCQSLTPACRWPIGCICRRTGRKDRERRSKAGVPKEIGFKTKPEIALEQMRWACEAGLAARRRVDGRGLWRRHASCAPA